MVTTLRLKFERKGPVRYIGHLDMMRYFQKAIKRAGIEVRYSEGFSPHQIMSFAYPLGVSMETLGDYLDIDVVSYKDCADITNRLNAVMSEGIRIIRTTALPKGAGNAMASVAAADYLLHILSENRLTKEELDLFLKRDELLIQKENGVEKDIRPGIYELKLQENDMLFMKLQSGSERNIKPVSVLESLSATLLRPISSDRMIRTEIYSRNENGILIPLG